ncbi:MULTISPECIES: YkoF family thiamine/hydroxymethylpyrimidine-binding protein [Alteromonadaceae]|uniref:YkoF family thiamine/hydroxymethylpyrimidine-binding protein n=1 Tax=Brumicola blandensis TaxID=3075611 RepID=A0AAW8R0V1_9ALTE|nr:MULTISPECIES: YkoF family thiamine/hydroxymethylpyrimidine-binding protein [unclassified Alteromonas]MDT0582916.1 YkoF family thiamine/hydroxymethylpyrimidine-binding protein [Alteromonas sp. W409]MDT0628332.1 YkoF family thiamine/hydroxymethylpyrimidine-binding protein [Alteromonas sp. W364]
MKLVVDISLYPLNEKYIAPIQAFIDRLNDDSQLDTSTSAASTIISGEYEHVMLVLGREMKRTYSETGQAVFVCKFLNGDKMGSGR